MLATTIPRYTWPGAGPLPQARTHPHLLLHRTGRLTVEARGHVLGFYVEDERFESLWPRHERYALQFLELGLGAVIEPDFSVWRDDPLTVQLWAIFRNRWLARYWQECGLPIIPNPNWGDRRTLPAALSGLPRRVPVLSLQCRTTRDESGRRLFHDGLREVLATVRPDAILLYGGVEAEEQGWLHLPRGPEYVHVPCWRRVAREAGRP